MRELKKIFKSKTVIIMCGITKNLFILSVITKDNKKRQPEHVLNSFNILSMFKTP